MLKKDSEKFELEYSSNWESGFKPAIADDYVSAIAGAWVLAFGTRTANPDLIRVFVGGYTPTAYDDVVRVNAELSAFRECSHYTPEKGRQFVYCVNKLLSICLDGEESIRTLFPISSVAAAVIERFDDGEGFRPRRFDEVGTALSREVAKCCDLPDPVI